MNAPARPEYLFAAESLARRFADALREALARNPEIDRVSCSLYDAEADEFRVFIRATRIVDARPRLEFALGHDYALDVQPFSEFLRAALPTGPRRGGPNAFALARRKEGFPTFHIESLCDRDRFLGYAYFDSRRRAAMRSALKERLRGHAQRFSELLVSELPSVRPLLRLDAPVVQRARRPQRLAASPPRAAPH